MKKGLMIAAAVVAIYLLIKHFKKKKTGNESDEKENSGGGGGGGGGSLPNFNVGTVNGTKTKYRGGKGFGPKRNPRVTMISESKSGKT